mgnify:CR=1 FL=1|tara:strand:- start:3253 stop:9489 length:6237 start_codon:yes stop_codon:yes gene_type:complete
MLGCTFPNFKVKEKVRREEISKAIQNPDDNSSKYILARINRYNALIRNEQGLLPIEEAIVAKNVKIVEALMNIDDLYYHSEISEKEIDEQIYKKILETQNVEMFNLISLGDLDYKLLLKIKECKYKNLENEFMKRISATELERLIVEGNIAEIEKQDEKWIEEHYKEKAELRDREISTAEILCIYGEESVIEKIMKMAKSRKKDIAEYVLVTASAIGDKKLVQYLLQTCQALLPNGVETSVKCRWGTDRTGLMCAAENGHEDICTLLLSKGADVNAKDNTKQHTALMFAAKNGQEKVCKLLLAKGAKIDIQNYLGWTPLILAARNGFKEVCDLFLKEREGVHEATEYEKATDKIAFTMAAARGHKEVCELLLKKNDTLDPNSIEEMSDGIVTYSFLIGEEPLEKTVLIHAAENGHEDVCKLLLENGGKANTKDKSGRTALIYAAENGHEDVCKLLLENGAEVNSVDNKGWTALILTAINGFKDVCELLLENGANIESEEYDEKWAALTCAVKYGNEDVCKLLLSKGANVNKTVYDREESIFAFDKTALMIATEQGKYYLCKLLLVNGAKVNAVISESGQTALMYAVNYGRKQICKLLINNGADIDIKDRTGKTALIHALNYTQNSLDLMLFDQSWRKMKRENMGEIALKEAEINTTDRENIYKLLLEKEAKVNISDEDGWTALMYAAKGGHEEACRLLLKKGAEVDALNNEKQTALIIAMENGYVETCKFLLENGAEVNSVDNKGWTALSYAVNTTYRDYDHRDYDHNDNKKIELFIKHGATIDKHSKKFVKQALADPYKEDLIPSIILADNFDTLHLDYYKASQCLSLDFLSNNFFEISNKNNKGYTSLHFASMIEDSSILKSIVENDKFALFIDNNENRNKITALRLALKHDLVDNAKILLSKGASPLYKTFLGGVRNILDGNKELTTYISSQMLLDLLRSEDLENAQKRIYGPSDLQHSELYKDIIVLSTVDDMGKNVFHHLAKCIEDIPTSEFLNRAMSLSSFDVKLLIQEDSNGMRPIHVAILNSNPYFIQHVNSSNILTIDELNFQCGNRTIFNLIMEEVISKETKIAVINYILKYSNSSEKDLIDKINSGKSVYEGENGNSIMDITITEDLVEVLFYIFNLGKVKDVKKLFIMASYLPSSQKCMEYLIKKLNDADKEEIINGKKKAKESKTDLKKASKEGATKNYIDLHDLCKIGAVPSLRIVLDFVKDQLMDIDEKGKLPLQVASELGKDDVVSLLLGYDFRKDTINPIYFKEGEIKKMQVHADNLGKSLMHSAVFSLSPHIVDLFSRLGCQLDLRDLSNNRAIDYLMNLHPKNDEERAKKLGTIYSLLCALCKREYDADFADECIHMSLMMNENKLVKELIASGMVNCKDRDGNTPLHLVVEKDNIEQLKILLGNKVKYTTRNNKGDTPLHLAKSVGIVRLILTNAIKRDITSTLLLSLTNKEEEPVLHRYVARSKEENLESLIKYALDNGADKQWVLRMGNYEQCNAIGIARKIGNEELVTLLTNYKIDTKEMDEREEKRRKDREIDEKAIKDEKDLQEIIAKGSKPVNKALSGSGRYAIHLAVERSEVGLIRKLVEIGAELNVEGPDKINSYRLAIKEGDLDSLSCLLSLGDVLDVDSQTESVLEIGITKGGECSDMVIRALSNSKHKENRAAYIMKALKILIKKAANERHFIDKAEQLIDNIGRYKIDVEGRTILLPLELVNVGGSVGVLRKALNTRDIGEVFEKNEDGNSCLSEILMKKGGEYLEEVIKVIDNIKDGRSNSYTEKLREEIKKKTEKMIESGKIKNLLMGLEKCGSNSSEKIMSDLIYLGAKKRDRDLVEALLRSFVKFVTKKDLAIDKWRERLANFLKLSGPISKLGGSDWVVDIFVNMVRPKQRREGDEEIIYINKVYREGKWVLQLKIPMDVQLLKYYVESLESFKEMTVKELQEGMENKWKRMKNKVRSQVREELGMIENLTITKLMLEGQKAKLLSDKDMKEYNRILESELKNVLTELGEYNDIYSRYKTFIKEKAEKVLDGEIAWNKGLENELKKLYKGIIDKRDQLTTRVEGYKKKERYPLKNYGHSAA